METWIEQGKVLALTYGLQALYAVVILVVGYLAARAVGRLVRQALDRTDVDDTLAPFVGSLVHRLLLLLAVVFALGALGIDTTSFAAVLAATGVAIGLAIQGSLGNVASGFLLIVLRPFELGDYIEAAGVEGTVSEIRVFATELTTPDNKQVIVPNSAIFADNIVNYSVKETRRIDLVFGIGYGDDLRKAKALLERVLASEPRVLDDPAPSVVVLELADSSVNFAVRPWVRRVDYWATRCDLIEKVKLEFDAHGISMPFPQHDVHLHQAA